MYVTPEAFLKARKLFSINAHHCYFIYH